MHLERKIESTVKAAIVAGVSGLITGKPITVRTYWDEDYSTRAASETIMPMVMIVASPSSRPVLEEPQRVVTIDVSCITQAEDDLDRRDLSTIYSRVRNLMETTAWDFGAATVYGGIEIPSPGMSEVDEATNRFVVSFQCAIHLCAESTEGHT